MRYAGFVLFVSLLGFAPGLARESRGDFAGTWTMDLARSESVHQDVPIESSTLVIRLMDSRMAIVTTWRERGKPAASTETLSLKLDGSETTSRNDAGATVTGKAHWEGANLLVDTAREINGATVTTR